MEVFHCIRKRREIRDYLEKPIPPEALKKILESGRLAPSSKNTQPWHFIVIRKKETLRKISQLTPTGEHIGRAPLAIALFMENAKLPEVDGARAMQNMMLAAWELGVGSCWVTNFDETAVKQALGVPNHLKLITVAPFGYPVEPRTTRKKKRKTLDEIVHYDRWGKKTDRPS